MENKKSFVAYCDWQETFEELSDSEAGKLVKHLFNYVNDKNPETSDKLTKMCFIPIKQSLKRDLKKYESYIEKQSVNGRKGGRPKNPTLTQITQPFIKEPKKADSVSVSVSVSDSDSVNEIKHTNNVNEEFLKIVCDFFSQTTEHLERKVWGFMNSLNNKGKLKEFEKQTKAYIKYKEISKEKIHSWLGFENEWDSSDWSDKITKINKTPEKAILNPFNEELITFNSNVNPTVFKLPRSQFLKLKKDNKSGGYKYKILA